ncbi:MAG: cellulase family glycosylhydrolase [Deltaproteobacteria bacterium]|nr:cellulase family glycosylhydrolase [Deltaproteobacteria bacterium]
MKNSLDALRSDMAHSLALLGLLVLFAAACGGGQAEPELPGLFSPPYTAPDGWVRDGLGRAVLLRGPNLANCQKFPDPDTGRFVASWLSEEDFCALASWGMNSIRFIMTWETIEPQPGQIDSGYLEELAAAAELAERCGILVILDMHQDLYARRFGGDGAPDWAVISDGLEFTPQPQWYLNYAQPAVQHALDNFFTNRDGILDHFAAAWAAVVERLRDAPNVVGYDLLNEPFPGSLAYELTRADQEYLQPFYEKLLESIGDIGPGQVFFFEPSAVRTNVYGDAFPSALEPFSRAQGRTALAPHLYDAVTTVTMIYDDNIERLGRTAAAMNAEAERLGVPLWVGEFSVWDGAVENGQAFLRDQLKVFDRVLAGWSFWNYDHNPADLNSPLNSPWMLEELVLAQPTAVSGEPLEIVHEQEGLTLHYLEAEIAAPTDILAPGSAPDVQVFPQREVEILPGPAPDTWRVVIWPEQDGAEVLVTVR